MRAHFLVFLLAGMVTTSAWAAQADGAVGHWEGAYTRLGAVQLTRMDFTRGAEGHLAGTFDIPEMGLYGEPVTDIAEDGDTLSFKVHYGLFTMTLHPEVGDMTGGNSRWNPAVSLHLKRALPVRNYTSRDIGVHNGAVTLAGSLYVPEQPGRHPLVIVIPGSGEGGRAQWEYRGLADMLASQHVAAFVYDKRGTGVSSKVAGRLSFDQLASDVEAIVETLRRQPEVDPARVGLMGLSQGGWIAPLAASRSRHVGFLILLVGPAVSVEEQERERVEYTLRQREAKPEDIAAALDYTDAFLKAAYHGGSTEVVQQKLDAIQRDKTDWQDVLAYPDAGESVADFIADWRAIAYDPKDVLRHTRLPLLALYGASDTLVPPDQNAPLLKSYLDAAGNKHYSIVTVPAVGHSFFVGQGLIGGDWKWPEAYWRWDRRAWQMMPSVVSWVQGLR
jgi:dienelactone hydrolase